MMGWFSRNPNYKKRSSELIGLGNIAGTMVLTMEDEKLTKLFMYCTRKKLADTWSGLFFIAAAGYSYLESKEGKKSGGTYNNADPIIAATNDAINAWDPKYVPMFEEYFHFIAHFRQSGSEDNAALSAAFLIFHFKRQPDFPTTLVDTLEDHHVMGTISGMLKSQFQRYWD